MKLFQLAWEDVIKGFVVAAITAILSAVLPICQAGKIPSLKELGAIGIIGLTAGIAYLIKNFLTNSQGKILKAEPKNEAEETKTDKA